MKKTDFFRGIIFFFFTGISLSIFAFHPILRNYSRSEYKAGTQNWAITQNNANFMYFANNNGLLEFDGKNWRTFTITNGTNVRSIHYASDGKYYASTFNEFGYFIKQNTGKFRYYSLTNSVLFDRKNPNELFNICEGEHKLFFQGEKEVYIYESNTLKKIPFNGRLDISGFANGIFFVSSTDKGVFMLNGKVFIKITGSEQLAGKKLASILPIGNNKTLFITRFDGVYIFDGMSVVPYKTGIDEFLRKNQVFCATTNGEKIVYGTIQQGIVIQDLKTNSFQFLNTFNGLQNNTVLCAKFDNENNLWLGLDKGIDYVMLNSKVMNLFWGSNLCGAGYCSITEGNTIYYGTNQGLYYGNIHDLYATNAPRPQLIDGMEGQVWCLTKIDQTLFCGTDQGSYLLNGTKSTRIAEIPGTWAFKKLTHHPGLILACSYHGLFTLKQDGKNWKFGSYLKGRFNESGPIFEEDTDGTIWFSHWLKGIYKLTLSQNADSITQIRLYNTSKGLPSNRNNTLYKIANKIVISSERGFFAYDKASDRMKHNQLWDNIFTGTPGSIRLHEDKKGNVWCVSGKFFGLARKKTNGKFEIDSVSYRQLQTKAIVGFEHFNFINDSNIIFGTEDGFSIISTQPKNEKKLQFKVVVNSIELTGTTRNDENQNQKFEEELNINKFKHSHNSLRFSFTAPEFRSDGQIQYSYMLEGYDTSWSDYSSNNFKEYTHLPRGSYTLKIRARNIPEPATAECSYTFEVLPAWYESAWARAFYLIIIVLSILILVRIIKKKSQQAATEMEERKEKEIQEQKKQFEEDTQAKKREIKELKNQQLQYELRHKSQELANSTMNVIRKNEMLLEIINHINKANADLKKDTDKATVRENLSKLERTIRQNIEHDDNWKRFEENFDLVYQNYLKRLSEMYPELNISDKKMCAYLKMDLSSKDIAQLMNMSVRSVETNRYRLRKKLGLDRENNLSDYLQKL